MTKYWLVNRQKKYKLLLPRTRQIHIARTTHVVNSYSLSLLKKSYKSSYNSNFPSQVVDPKYHKGDVNFLRELTTLRTNYLPDGSRGASRMFKSTSDQLMVPIQEQTHLSLTDLPTVLYYLFHNSILEYPNGPNFSHKFRVQ